MKYGIAVAGFLFSCVWALAAGLGGGSTANNLTIFDYYSGCNASNNISATVSANGTRTSAPTALTPGEKTFIHLDVGDSLSTNVSTDNAVYTATNPTKNQNFNIYTGANFQFTDPLMGTGAPGVANTGGSWQARLNDSLIAAGKFARAIALTPGIGGTCSLDWAPTGTFFHRAVVACLYAQRMGWPISGSGDSGNWRFAINYALGTNDNAQSKSAASFTANAQAFAAGIRGYGCTGDIFVAKTTMLSGVINAAIQAAQVALVDNVIFFAGYDRDAVTTNPGLTDGLHMTGAGNQSLANDLSTKIQAHY